MHTLCKHDSFKGGWGYDQISYPILATNKVSLIYNKETDVLDIFPLFPSAGQNVPLVWCADDDVSFS